MSEIRTPEYRLLTELIRECRIDAGLRQVDLADAIGVPQSMISKLEVGERRLDIMELRKICGALGMSLLEFVSRFEALADPTHETDR